MAPTKRNRTHVRAFKRLHPCPATGKPVGSCPGYVVDHIVPLCAGGPDHLDNMQWQTHEAAKIKDRQERRLCSRRQADRRLPLTPAAP